jgi:hypothetical protein
VAATLSAFAVAGAAAAFSVGVWPAADNPDLDPRGSPGVARNGDSLEFAGPVPWSGRQVEGELKGRRVSFGPEVPETGPSPDAWLHYSPDRVVAHTPKSGTTSWGPIEFERKARIGYLLICFLVDFVIASVFFFSLTVLLRIKRVELPAYGPLRVLARCVIPACLYQAAATLAGPRLPAYAPVAIFVLVVGMNAILFVLGAKPAPEEAPPFEV